MDTKNVAVYRCTSGKRHPVIADVWVTLKPGVSEEQARANEKEGAIAASRKFKRMEGLHPCCKVDCKLERFLWGVQS